MDVDYIIVGQGISGTMLSYYLLQAGKKVVVIDKWQEFSASRVASGIINPITGRRIVKTWMIDELIPFAEEAYAAIGELLQTTIAKQIDILSFHSTEQMSSAWHERLSEQQDYIGKVSDETPFSNYFNVRYGIGITNSSIIVDLDNLLAKWRDYLKSESCLYESEFAFNKLDVLDNKVLYEDIAATGIIFCDGVSIENNPFFSKLPSTEVKGEALIVEIPGLPETNIYKQGLTIVPLKNHQFWVGSSFDWDFEDTQPTQQFRLKAEEQLKSWLKLPYKVISHLASVRPGSIERRPFVGVHPVYDRIGILNGMGTKGCSLAPYFAHQLCLQLLDNQTIIKEANVSRFTKLLINS